MSVKIYLKDNIDGTIHEYGTNPHDSLILQEDGSLHYENLQNCAGTQHPKEGYTFCNEDGTDPRTDEECIKHGVEPYLNIGGEGADLRLPELTCDTCRWNGTRYQKCTTCRENKNLQSRWEPRKVGGFSEILQPSE